MLHCTYSPKFHCKQSKTVENDCSTNFVTLTNEHGASYNTFLQASYVCGVIKNQHQVKHRCWNITNVYTVWWTCQWNGQLVSQGWKQPGYYSFQSEYFCRFHIHKSPYVPFFTSTKLTWIQAYYTTVFPKQLFYGANYMNTNVYRCMCQYTTGLLYIHCKSNYKGMLLKPLHIDTVTSLDNPGPSITWHSIHRSVVQCKSVV